jgi:hypothetical protein
MNVPGINKTRRREKLKKKKGRDCRPKEKEGNEKETP